MEKRWIGNRWTDSKVACYRNCRQGEHHVLESGVGKPVNFERKVSNTVVSTPPWTDCPRRKGCHRRCLLDVYVIINYLWVLADLSSLIFTQHLKVEIVSERETTFIFLFRYPQHIISQSTLKNTINDDPPPPLLVRNSKFLAPIAVIFVRVPERIMCILIFCCSSRMS